MSFEFSTAERIIFGKGTIYQLGEIAAKYGKKTCYFHGRNQEITETTQRILLKKGIHIVDFTIHGEPTIREVKEHLLTARKEKCEIVISVGGGSVIDTGKAVSAMITNPGELEDYIEVIGKGHQLTQRAAPFVAVPTTAGTGSEVTKNAVLLVSEKKIKVSMRSPLMIPRVALLDPELTLSMPAEVTASTGMDALTQMIEPFISNRHNPIVDIFCRDGIKRVMRSLFTAFIKGVDLSAREDMCWASLYGGIALANAGLGAVHGFAAPIGGMFDAPHGAVCASLLPHVILQNYQAILERNQNPETIDRFNELFVLVTGNQDADITACIDMIQKLSNDMKIPTLKDLGISSSDIPNIIEKAIVSSSMKGNPIQLTIDELSNILEKAM